MGRQKKVGKNSTPSKWTYNEGNNKCETLLVKRVEETKAEETEVPGNSSERKLRGQSFTSGEYGFPPLDGLNRIFCDKDESDLVKEKSSNATEEEEESPTKAEVVKNCALTNALTNGSLYEANGSKTEAKEAGENLDKSVHGMTKWKSDNGVPIIEDYGMMDIDSVEPDVSLSEVFSVTVTEPSAIEPPATAIAVESSSESIGRHIFGGTIRSGGIISIGHDHSNLGGEIKDPYGSNKKKKRTHRFDNKSVMKYPCLNLVSKSYLHKLSQKVPVSVTILSMPNARITTIRTKGILDYRNVNEEIGNYYIHFPSKKSKGIGKVVLFRDPSGHSYFPTIDHLRFALQSTNYSIE